MPSIPYSSCRCASNQLRIPAQATYRGFTSLLSIIYKKTSSNRLLHSPLCGIASLPYPYPQTTLPSTDSPSLSSSLFSVFPSFLFCSFPYFSSCTLPAGAALCNWRCAYTHGPLAYTRTHFFFPSPTSPTHTHACVHIHTTFMDPPGASRNLNES